jgi:hypothetical protein
MEAVALTCGHLLCRVVAQVVEQMTPTAEMVEMAV